MVAAPTIVVPPSRGSHQIDARSKAVTLLPSYPLHVMTSLLYPGQPSGLTRGI